jgi:hypothetical protein
MHSNTVIRIDLVLVTVNFFGGSIKQTTVEGTRNPKHIYGRYVRFQPVRLGVFTSHTAGFAVRMQNNYN